MKGYSKVSKFGIIISALAVILSTCDILYSVIKGIPVRSYGVGLFSCITILFANIAIAEHNKNKKTNKR